MLATIRVRITKYLVSLDCPPKEKDYFSFLRNPNKLRSMQRKQFKHCAICLAPKEKDKFWFWSQTSQYSGITPASEFRESIGVSGIKPGSTLGNLAHCILSNPPEIDF